MRAQPLAVSVGSGRLMGGCWRSGDDRPTVVLLHSGVADRRSWYGVADRLAPTATVVAYDRRGFGETGPPATPFSHLDDLMAVLDAVADRPAWLVGSSAGGGLALDATLAQPGRVAGLVLLAPAVGGAPPPSRDPDTARLDRLREAALAAGDLDATNRWDTWLWLDGPGEPEGRVSGPQRDLALAMNAAVLRHHRPELVVASQTDVWARLDEVQVPATVICGDRDVPFLRARCVELARRLPQGRHRVVAGAAHVPHLERPEVVAQLITEALSGR
ncbi:MAG: alpha/beta fold hydrolase [Candidatus Dormibacteria bacterium]